WAAAFGTWARDGNRPSGRRAVRPSVVIGRDARTSGPMFAQAATAGLNSIGCDVIDVGLVATPTVQLAVEHHRAAGGIILTASHNPIEWNALKFVGPDGIFLDSVAGTRVRDLAAGEPLPRASYNAIGGVEPDSDAISRHLAAVLALRGVAVRAIRRRRFRVALDTVRGAGGALMPELLERLGCRVTAINLETDGLFPRPPEPVPENLKALGALVRRKKADIGGDGNGGVMYPALDVGRDAPVAAALVLSLLARERTTVSELVARAPRYTIVKAKVPRGARLEQVYEALRQRFGDATVDRQDGLRLSWPDRWLHVRPSGTEPIIRLIAEAPTSADAERLIEEGRRLCAAS